MGKTVEYLDRKKCILAATVEAYTREGRPVSSQDLAKAFALSSATIRNILAELEQEGYLAHTHTSSGRLPTNKGYRYYVDFLMSRNELSQEQKLGILDELRLRTSSNVEELLEKATDVLSSVTHTTAIVSYSLWQDKFFFRGLTYTIKEPEFHDLRKLESLISLLEEKKQLIQILNQEFHEPHKIYIGEELGCPGIDDTCSLIVSNYHKKGQKKGKLAVLGPRRMSYEQIISSLDFISRALDSLIEE